MSSVVAPLAQAPTRRAIAARTRASAGYVLCTSGQGPSPEDLRYARADGHGFSSYIVDRGGYFYRHDYPASRDAGEHDRRITRWKREKNSACFVPAPCDNYECRRQ
jgi:hypothetical protein